MLSACGVTVVWEEVLHAGSEAPPRASNRWRYAGVIKRNPEDFVVVEVDHRGAPTFPVRDYSFSAEAPHTPATAAEDDILDDAEDTEGPTPALVPAPPSDCSAPRQTAEEMSKLVEAVGSQVRSVFGTTEELLRRLCGTGSATSAQGPLPAPELLHVLSSVLPPSACPQLLDAPPHAPVLAGRIAFELPCVAASLSKEERLQLHLAVRSAYPFLRSVVEAAPGGPSLVLTVDPGFVIFAVLLGGDAALQLSSWGLQRLQGSSRSPPAPQAEAAQRTTYSAKFMDVPPAVQALQAVLAPAAAGTDVVKVCRRAMHEVLRQNYPYVRCRVVNSIVSFSCQPQGRHKSGRATTALDGAPAAKRTAVEPARNSFFLYAIVKKRDVDTAEMKEVLAEALCVSSQSICLAGMKDKRAVTYQLISLPVPVGPLPALPLSLSYAGDPSRLVEVLATSSPQHFTQPIRIGCLKGNSFEIVVREMRVSDLAEGSPILCATAHIEELQRRLRQAEQFGFINYFGQQRFSESIADIADHTGIYLFNGDWCKAVRSLFRAAPDLYGSFPDKMDPRCVPCSSRDMQLAATALKHTFRSFFSEHTLHPVDDVLGESSLWSRVCEVALTKVPYALRSMWVHAGQSIFFNQCSSLLLRKAQSYLQTARGPEARQQAVAVLACLHIPLGGGQRPLDWSDASVFRGAADNLLGEAAAGPRAAFRHFLYEAMEEALVDLGYCGGAVDTLPAPETSAPAPLSPRTLSFLSVKRVCGVPIATSWRRLLAFPRGTHCEAVGDADARFTFYLPSSSYATVLLREVLLQQEWW
eukprot:gene2037-1227_t